MIPRFWLCEKLATELLSKQHFNTPKFNILNMELDNNIIIDSIQNYCSVTGLDENRIIYEDHNALHDGFTICDTQTKYNFILYNDYIENHDRLTWTIAHEIGHIYLNHESDNDLEEIEAHCFAAQLLAPEYSLVKMEEKLGELNVNDIYLNFNLSMEASEKRLSTFQKKTSHRACDNDRTIWKDTYKQITDYCNRKKINRTINCEKIDCYDSHIILEPNEHELEFFKLEDQWLYDGL